MVRSRLDTREAYQYVKNVKDEFKDNRVVYDTFLKIMKDFANHKIGCVEVIAKVKELFKGHRKLTLSFNKFLPKGYNITFESDHIQLVTPESRESLDFIDKVKATFHDNYRTYDLFIEIFRMHKHGMKSVSEVFHEVFNGLFENHHDLRVEFARFLPRYLINLQDKSAIVVE